MTNATPNSVSPRPPGAHPGPSSAEDGQEAGSLHHARQATLIASLRARYAVADLQQDAEAKQALFKEAAYLGIRPEAYQG